MNPKMRIDIPQLNFLNPSNSSNCLSFMAIANRSILSLLDSGDIFSIFPSLDFAISSKISFMNSLTLLIKYFLCLNGPIINNAPTISKPNPMMIIQVASFNYYFYELASVKNSSFKHV